MKSAKIGRNELCPCGSGKKYKRCCIGKAERAPVTIRHRPPGPPAASAELELARRIASLGPRAVSAFSKLMEQEGEDVALEAAERWGALLATGGPLAHVRFTDSAAFEDAVALVVDEAARRYGEAPPAGGEDEPPWLRAFRKAAPTLVSRADLDRMVEVILSTLQGPAIRDPRDWESACMLAITGLMGLETKPFAPETVPLLTLAFRAQLGERMVATQDTFGQVRGMVRDLAKRGAPEDIYEMSQSPLLGQAAALLQRDPLAAAALQADMAKDVDAALEAIKNGQAPPFVAFDEYIYLLAELSRELPARPESGGTSSRVLYDSLLSAIEPAVREHLQRPWTTRLMTLANAPRCHRKRRQLLGRMLTAVTLEPGPVALGIAKWPAIWWRSDEEREAIESLLQHADFPEMADAAATWLRDHGLDDTLVRRAVAITRPQSIRETAPEE